PYEFVSAFVFTEIMPLTWALEPFYGHVVETSSSVIGSTSSGPTLSNWAIGLSYLFCEEPYAGDLPMVLCVSRRCESHGPAEPGIGDHIYIREPLPHSLYY